MATCDIDNLVLVLACPECRDPARWLAFQGNTGPHAPAPDDDRALSIRTDAQFQKFMGSFFYQFLGGRKRE